MKIFIGLLIFVFTLPSAAGSNDLKEEHLRMMKRSGDYSVAMSSAQSLVNEAAFRYSQTLFRDGKISFHITNEIKDYLSPLNDMARLADDGTHSEYIYCGDEEHVTYSYGANEVLNTRATSPREYVARGQIAINTKCSITVEKNKTADKEDEISQTFLVRLVFDIAEIDSKTEILFSNMGFSDGR